MKPFSNTDLRQTIDAVNSKLTETIEKLSSDILMANDLDVLADNYFEEYHQEPLIIQPENASKREMTQNKIRIRIDPFWSEIRGKDYADVDGISFRFHFPFTGDKSLFYCRASTYSLSGYPEIELFSNYFIFTKEYPMKEFESIGFKEKIDKEVAYDLSSISKGIEYANKDINSFNANLLPAIKNLLINRKRIIEKFFTVSKAFEVPINKSEYTTNVMPVKKKILPVAAQYKNESTYCISDSDYKLILEVIKNTCTTYERTPGSYRAMGEEDLRNAILATLNVFFPGQANGETFRKNGKTDISIEFENRAAFVAECKMWTGAAEIPKAFSQLDSYLTWRDVKSSLIYFVRNKEFLPVVDTTKQVFERLPNMRRVVCIDRNEIDCQYVSESNPGQIQLMRVFLFNLYSPK